MKTSKLEEKILALDPDLIHENTLIMRASLYQEGFTMKDLHDLGLRDLCELYEMAQQHVLDALA